MQSTITERCGKCGILQSLNDLQLEEKCPTLACEMERVCEELGRCLALDSNYICKDGCTEPQSKEAAE